MWGLLKRLRGARHVARWAITSLSIVLERGKATGEYYKATKAIIISLYTSKVRNIVFKQLILVIRRISLRRLSLRGLNAFAVHVSIMHILDLSLDYSLVCIVIDSEASWLLAASLI
jgi:hypothetical protein